MDEISQFTSYGYVRDTGDSFTEHYDGSREDIPWEYRVTATPEEQEFLDDAMLDEATDLAFDMDVLFERAIRDAYSTGNPEVHERQEALADDLINGDYHNMREHLSNIVDGSGEYAQEVAALLRRIEKFDQDFIEGEDRKLTQTTELTDEKLVQAQEHRATMTVLVVEPLKEPYVKEIAPGLSAMQQEVDGLIAAAYPFDDQVAVICNDEGKINGMELNRALRDDRGQIYDIVAGPFLVAGLGEEDFASLPPELAQKYMEHFKTPEMFAMVDGEITALPVLAEPIAPDNFLTGERIKTPRGSFSLTDMTREQMEAAGYGYHHSSDDGRYHIMGNGTRAFAIVNENARTYEIYQLKDTPDRRNYAFEPLERLHEQGRRVDMQNYDMVYSGVMRPGENMKSIYTRFNIDHPEDFKGHSLSVSDVVVIHQGGQDTAHYCDSFGFAEVPEFLEPENHLKNAEMAMEDDLGMIDGIINNGPKEVTPPGTDDKTSIRERLAEAKRECAERKPPEAKHPEKNGPEHDI